MAATAAAAAADIFIVLGLSQMIHIVPLLDFTRILCSGPITSGGAQWLQLHLATKSKEVPSSM